MKTTLIALALFLSMSALAANDFSYYLVPTVIKDLIDKHNKSFYQYKSLKTYKDHHLMKLPEASIHNLSHIIHAEAHTCGGFIEVNEEVANNVNLDHFLNPTQKMVEENFDNLEPMYFAETESAIQKVNKERFVATLTRLTQFPDRYSRNQNGLDAANHIEQTMLEFAQARDRQDVSSFKVETGSRYMQPSIVVKIAGSDSSLPAVVIGGHIDTFSRNKPGADDDGSGTASIMEAFRAIIENNVRFKRDVYFMGYAAEEMGLVGSKKVVQKFKNEQIPIRAVMQLDMTAFKSNRDVKQIFFVSDYTSTSLTRFTKKLVVRYLGITNDQIGDFECRYGCSDHASWNRQGYAAVTPFEADFSNHNRAIHSARDTMDLLDMDHAQKYIHLAVAFITELAQPQGR